VSRPIDTRRREAESLFERALDLDPGERGDWLAGATGGDAELRAEVESLLEAHERAEGVLERADALRLATASLVGASPVLPGARLGRYRIVREIGRGGMSTVYLAERADGQFQRDAALKIVRAGPYDEDLRRRLLTERQILASLDHPDIARLLDGDLTSEGRPYLVMEHVEGLPIDGYCDRSRLTVIERLRLFCRVARAVHHAHRNLVVHRDLKPSNVLVTPDGQPKLLDFGIARILDTGPVDAVSPVTRPGFLPMTPEYASPEQMRGEVLTTGSDVYSLGIVLYELLCGHRPYAFAGGSPREVVEAVCGREPEPPSRRLQAEEGFVCARGRRSAATPAAVAAARRSSPERLERRLRGDLDAIALKALRKEPAERYASAEDLARDIERHRDGLPVEAHRRSRLYRGRKFVRRHRAGTVAASVAMLSLVVGAAAAAWQAAEARGERDRADAARTETEAALDRAQDVTGALAQIIGAGDPWAPGFQDTATARALLALGLARVEALEGQPGVQAALLDVLARVRASLGGLEEADALARRSLDLRLRSLGEEDPEVAASLNILGDIARKRGRYHEAEALHREALDLQVHHLGPQHPEVAGTLTDLALQIPGQRAEAEELSRRAVAIRRASLGAEHPLVASSLMVLGSIQRSRGNPAGAEAAYREALEIRRKVLGPEHPEVANSMVHLADLVQMYVDRTSRAESLYRQALDMQRRALGANHPARVHALGSLAELLSGRGEHAAAERLLREGLEIRRAAFGPRHRAAAEGLGQLAAELRRQGRLGEAERLLRESLTLWREAVGPDHFAVSGALSGIADVLVDGKRYDEAEALYLEALEIRRQAIGEEDAMVGLTLGSLGRLHALREEYARAESLYHRALDLFLPERTERSPNARRLHRELAEVYAAWGRDEEARKFRLLADGAAQD
jgi:serine/threonine-protein kinase